MRLGQSLPVSHLYARDEQTWRLSLLQRHTVVHAATRSFRDSQPRRERSQPRKHADSIQRPDRSMDNMAPRQSGEPSRPASTRMVAVQQLMRIEKEGAYAGLVNGAPGTPTEEDEDSDEWGSSGRQGITQDLNASAAGLAPMQQRTLRSLVSGVTRWRRRLDYSLSTLSGRGPADMDGKVRQILRLALYELLHMSLAPHALGEFTELARQAGANEGAVRFVNGVLRSAARHREAGTLPDPKSELVSGSSSRDVVRCLAITHSHPTWMVKRWVERWGTDAAEALMKHNNRPPTYTIRVNTLPGLAPAALEDLLREQGVDVAPNALNPSEFLDVKAGLQALLAEGHVSQGRCAVQDVSSGVVVALALNPQPGERLLDCCAAPGGKALYAAARMKGQGSITAIDISGARVRAMDGMAAKHGVPRDMLHTEAADLLQWAPAQAAQGSSWDRVLLDAPCSGTGVLCKRADLRWRRSPEDMKQLVELQARLLDSAASLVRPGGLLVYSTCSIEAEEDQQQVQQFLDKHPEFQLQQIQHDEARAQGIDVSIITPEGFLQTLPAVHGVDGIFAARLVRKV